MTTLSYEYKVHNKVGFEHELGKIVNKYGATVNVEYGDPITYKMQFEMFDGSVIKRSITKHPVKVDFDFAEYKIEGYTYLGCIQDEMMMGLITVHGNDLVEEDASAEIVDFVQHFKEIPCHNCGKNHRRKYGHIFRVNETGELVIFGSQCAKNWFGIDFDRLLRFFERVKVFMGSEWEEDYIRQYHDKTIYWPAVAKLAYYQIKTYGYLSGSKAREWDRSSSADSVRAYYNYRGGKYDEGIEQDIKNIRDMAENDEFPNFDVMMTNDYINGKTENLTEFEHNLRILQEKMKIDAVTYHSFGFLTFLVYKEFFHNEVKPTKKEFIIPEWAVKGTRFKKNEKATPVVVSHTHEFDGSFGRTIIYTFESDNIRFKWFTTADQGIEIGDEVILNGFTVKGTEDNQYGKAVIINRANLELAEEIYSH